MEANNLGLLKALAVIAVIIAVAVVAVYIMGQFEQTRPFYEQIMGYFNQAKNWVTQNWVVVTGSIGTIATVGGAAYSKVSAAKNQVTQVTDAARSQISSLTGEKEKLEETLAGYETQAKTTAEGYEAKIAEMQKQLDASTVDTTEISKLKAQVQSVEKQNSDFVTSLLKAANGAVVVNPVDGKTYSVLKLPPEETTVVK